MSTDPMSIAQTSTLTTTDNFTLFSRRWLPPDGAAPIGVLALIHGVCEHSGRYQHVGAFFAEKGFAVFAIDLRGHGQSSGTPVHVNRFDDYLTDVQTMLIEAKAQYPDLPVFLLGHSMGGLITLTYALKRPDEIQAVVTSCAGLKLALEVPGWKEMMGNLLSGVYPTLAMPVGIESEMLTHDPEMIAAHQNDPLIHDKATVRWYTEFTAAMAWANANANTLALPAMITQGGADPTVDPAGSRQFAANTGRQDTVYREYPDLYHEILNEPQKFEIMTDMAEWLLPQTQTEA